MDSVKKLLENFWIDKSKDKDTYIKTKREINQARKFIVEQLGWRLIINDKILKVEKIPACAESFMGITEFTDKLDYCILSALLIFLEDREDGEPFLLSELVDMITIQLKEFIQLDSTIFSHRKSLVRALKFAENTGLMKIVDSSNEKTSDIIDREVLYVNTGLSRYFATNFNRDISSYKTYKDFEKEHIDDTQTDRGHFRINRVYRQLVASPGVYWTENDNPDSIYIKNQRNAIQKTLDSNIGGELRIHKNSAFFVMYENDCTGECFPDSKAISEIVLLVCSEIRKQTEQNILVRNSNDCIYISMENFKSVIKNCRDKYVSAWSKEYREMTYEKLILNIIGNMKIWKMLDVIDSENIVIYSSAGIFDGKYPKDFKIAEGEE
ncbi:MAG: TIGR02678 family protein [Clostridia bacterium]|nr:TIGR02678 family protein [Clostridia bacterium]